MARLARLYVPDQPQHVILRGLDQQPAFVDDQDYELFIDCLKAASRDHHLSIHAYALMPGAVQLLVTPTEESSLPKAMQAVGRRYVAHFNRRYARRGTLWEGRYRATVIEGERYFLLASRVVEMCAGARADSSSAPEDYRWSSYRHHIGLTLDSLITDHPLYWSLGNTPFERQRAYRELCDSRSTNERPTGFSRRHSKAGCWAAMPIANGHRMLPTDACRRCRADVRARSAKPHKPNNGVPRQT